MSESASDFVARLGVVLNLAEAKGQIKQFQQSTKLTFDTSGVKTGAKTVSTFSDATGKAYKNVELFNAKGEKVSGTLTQVGGTATTAGGKIKAMGSGFVSTLGKVVKFGAATAIISAVTSAISAGIDAVTEYDDAITQFKKVSDLSGDSLTEYGVKLGKMGESVAKSRNEMIESATEYKKSGYSDSDSATLAKVSSLYQNIADEELSASDASSVIISQMKAFNISAEDSTKIIDSINEVSNKFAVSSSDVGKGLTAAGSALSTYGNSFDETIGLVTAGTEIMHGKSTQVARGLNTIAGRISKNSDALKEYHINIKDKTTGDLKSTYEILKELSPKWDKMTSSQKVAISNALAGTNQYKVFAAVMGNFDTAIKATETSQNSAGSATKENAKYMDSLQGKVDQLKAAFQELVLGNGGIVDVAKWFVDAGTAILKFANSDLGKAIIKMAAFAAAGAGVIKVAKLITGAFGAIRTGSWIKNLIADFSSLSKTGKVASKVASAVKGVGVAGETAGAGVSAGAGTAVAGLSAILPVIAAVAAGFAGIAVAYWYSGKPKRDYEQAKSDLTDLQDQYSSLEDKVTTLQAKESNGTITSGEKIRLQYLKEQTKEMEKQIALKQKDVVDKAESAFSYQYSRKVKSGSGYGKTITSTATGKDAIATSAKSIAKVSKAYAQGTKSAKKYFSLTKKNSNAYKNTAKNVKNLQSLKGEYDTLKKSHQKLTSSQSKNYKTVTKALEEYAAATGDMTGLTKKQQKQAVKLHNTYQKQIKVTKSLKKLNKNSSTKDITNTFKKLGKQIGITTDKAGKFSKIDVSTFASQMATAGKNSSETADYLKDVVDSGGKMGTIDVSTFESKMKDAGVSASDTLDYLQKIADANPDVKLKLDGSDVAISDLTVVNGKLTTATKTTATPKVKADTSAFDHAVSSVASKMASVNKMTGTATISVITKEITVKSTKKEHAKGTNNANDEMAIVNDNPSGGKANGKYPEIIQRKSNGKMFIANNGEETMVHLNQGDKVYTAKKTKQMLGGMSHYATGRGESKMNSLEHKYNMGEISESAYYKKLEKLNKKYYAHKKKYLDDYRSNLESIYQYEEQKYTEILDDKISALGTESGATAKNFKATLKYLKKLKKQGKITAEDYTDYLNQYYQAKAAKEITDYTNGKTTYKKALAALKKLVKAKKITWSEYYDYIDQLQDEAEQKYEDALNDQQDKLDVQQSILEWYAKKQQDSIDAQVKELETKKDLLEAQKDATDSAAELAELQKDLADAQNTKVRVFSDGEWQWVADAKAVSDAQDALDDYKTEQQEDAIDDQIDALNDQSDAWDDYVSNYEDLQEKLENEYELGMTYEQYILNNRITNVESFTNAFADLVQKQVDLYKKLDDTEAAYANSKKTTTTTSKTTTSTTGYASGTDSMSEDGVYSFNELGDELFIPSNVNYAPVGSGVIPHTMSQNLKDIGMHTWRDIESLGNSSNNVDDHSVNISSMSVTSDNAQTFLKQMQNLVNTNN